MELRPATQADDADLVALDRTTWSPQTTPTPAPPEGGTFFSDRRSADEVIVAEQDGRVVGYAIVQRTSLMPSHGHVLMVNGVAVDPALQGRGLGRRLVRAAQDEAVRRGARKLSLRVLSTNPSAVHLYESCGFVTEGVLREEFELDDGFADDVLMAWFPPRP
ncbi:GNAT family N-acetyltransferase [Nocardioides rotundus]|uniref:GNAT family N-acetyltransferase n=1 Tax=Nocardioides rotundus TaxID=1774216 RepID=UPI001CC00499|nr:GNAT family N-acetyltransferase [Nocardioides rotundus]UAL30770.1 GNAT family N-acetyltransferase [Nocardioides rotundus]